MNKQFRITLLECLLSTVFLLQFPASDATKAVSQACQHIAENLDEFGCDAYMKWKEERPEDAYCITEILNSKRIYDSKKHQAYSTLTNLYCSGVSRSSQCSTCLNNAFYEFYDKNLCLNFDDSKINNVENCLKQYQSREFSWSRDVTFQKSKKTVHLNTEQYHKCLFEDEEIPVKQTVIFPVYFKLRPEHYDKIVNVLLSFILEAFGIQKADNSKRITCQHIKDTNLLLSYKRFSEFEMNKVSLEVKTSYSNLRRSMCRGLTQSSCMECFEKSDSLFLFHLYNIDSKLSSMREDFNNIKDSLEMCMKNVVNKKYSSLSSLTKNPKGKWNTDFSNCLNEKSKEYLGKIESNTKTIEYIGDTEAVVRTVAFNYFAFQIYQQNNQNSRCNDVNRSNVLCAAWETIKSITIFSAPPFFKHVDEDRQLSNLAVDIGSCGTE